MKSKETNSLSIILPTLNESENIKKLIDAIILCLVQVKNLQIIVVDDNSSDGTSTAVLEKANQLSNTNVQIKLIKNPLRLGLGSSILVGINSAKYDLVVVMDADFTHSPKYISNLLQESKRASVVIGSRYVPGGYMHDKKLYYSSKLYNRFLKFFLKMKTKDLLGGFYILKKSHVKLFLNPEIFSGYGDYFFWFMYGVENFSNLKSLEIPVTFERRLNGTSKSNRFSMLFSYFISSRNCKRYFLNNFS